MSTTSTNISVIICAYTEERWLDLVAAIASLKQQTLLPYEIILVIDNNRQLFERVQKNFSETINIENKAARGLSGARNTGLAQANGTFVAFLDDDAEAAPDWLELLYKSLQDPHVLGVGGTVVPRWMGKQPRWFPPEFYWVVGCTYQKQPRHPIEVRNPYGGCTCIKREVFEEIGGFREGIGRVGNILMGGEETELSIRAKQRWPDRVFLYEPKAYIYHRIPQKRARLRYFLARCYAEGRSKAAITRYVGAKDSLSSERTYTLYTLPYAILQNLGALLIYRDPRGFLRGGTILLGLLVTTLGYTKESIKLAKMVQSPHGWEEQILQPPIPLEKKSL